MGANAATKAYGVVENLKNILAIELFTACQALEFRWPEKTSPVLATVFDSFRKSVAKVEHDRLLSTDIWMAKEFLENNQPPVI